MWPVASSKEGRRSQTVATAEAPATTGTAEKHGRGARATLNDELKSRNAELITANSDLANALANVDIPIVIVGSDLCIRRFTPAAEKLLNLIDGSIGRRLSEIRPNLEMEDLASLASVAIDSGTLQEREVKEKNGKWYMARARPYKTWENKIDGAVLSFLDIDALKRSLEQLRQYASALIEHAPEPLLMLDSSLRVWAANRAFYDAFQVTAEETERRPVFELGNGQWNIPWLRDRLSQIFSDSIRMDNFEAVVELPRLGKRAMLLDARLIQSERGEQLVHLALQDVTEKRALGNLKAQLNLLDLVAAVLVRDQAGTIQYWNRGAEDLYGWTKEEAKGKKASDLLRTVYPMPPGEIEQEAIRAGRWEGTLLQYARDGARLQVVSRWAPQPRSDDGQINFLEVNTNVTALKESEVGLRTLSSQLIRTQDAEQRRIARELHDSVGQKLVALKMALNAAGKEASRAKVKTSLGEGLNFTDQIMKEISSMAYLLHPPMLEDVGLVSAIRWMVDGMSKRSDLQMDLSAPHAYKRLPEASELALFRVAQESLTNVVRHSGARKVTIRLEQTAKEVTLEVSDDGKGIPDEAARKTTGVGLAGMKERMAHVGGSLEVKSTGKGTVVRALLPVIH